MWLLTDAGFFSVIAYDRARASHSDLPDHDDPENWLVVRTRARDSRHPPRTPQRRAGAGVRAGVGQPAVAPGVTAEGERTSFASLQGPICVHRPADLIAEDEAGNTVVIENQLDRSDHDHLGKVITYVSVVEAKAAVWIVSDPRPEHVRAVAWLNESVADDRCHDPLRGGAEALHPAPACVARPRRGFPLRLGGLPFRAEAFLDAQCGHPPTSETGLEGRDSLRIEVEQGPILREPRPAHVGCSTRCTCGVQLEARRWRYVRPRFGIEAVRRVRWAASASDALRTREGTERPWKTWPLGSRARVGNEPAATYTCGRWDSRSGPLRLPSRGHSYGHAGTGRSHVEAGSPRRSD